MILDAINHTQSASATADNIHPKPILNVSPTILSDLNIIPDKSLQILETFVINGAQSQQLVSEIQFLCCDIPSTFHNIGMSSMIVCPSCHSKLSHTAYLLLVSNAIPMISYATDMTRIFGCNQI